MSAKLEYLLDTSLLLRFLLNDHPGHGAAAKKLFEDAAAGKLHLRVPFIAITDAVFELENDYKVGRADIGRGLLTVLTAPGVKLTAPRWFLDALELYRSRNVSFGDACIMAEAESGRFMVVSFDRGLDKLPGLKRHEPRA